MRVKATRMLSVCCLVVLVCLQPAARLEAAPQLSESKTALWQQACRSIVAGRIEAGAESVQQLVKRKGDQPDLGRVRTWLTDYEKLQAERDRFRKADHEYHTARAAESIDKGEWLAATQYLSGAYDTAKDSKAFVDGTWTRKLVKQILAEAESLYRKGEWADAAGIYAFLAHMYEDDLEYDRMKRRCLRHARLEVVYKKDNEAKWKKDLEGIEQDMVRDAFLQVGRHYVREANFKKALAGGIENLQILAKTTNLAEVFPRLGDQHAVVRFTGEITSLARRVQDDCDAREGYNWFREVLKYNARSVQLPEGLIINEFMDGALEPLDRFSNMIWPADLREFKKHTMGRFQGVGIQIRKRKDGKLLVVTPLPGTPAHRAGVRAGDIILKVDGEDIASLEIDDVVPKIMGPKGTVVKLTIQRGDKPPYVVPIERGVITITSVRGYARDDHDDWDYMIDPEQRIAYIRIDPSFTDGTVQEMKDAIKAINEQGARALILDLRFNPGGLLRTAIEVTDLFLPPGKGILSTRGQHSDTWSATSTEGAVFAKDMVVLVNDTSASASEILAGALQDNRRAIVMGHRTHGKGSVQNLIPLSNETAYLKLTTALYYLPSDRCPDKQPGAKSWGVTPDIALPLRPTEKLKVVQIRRDSDVVRAGQPPQPASQPTSAASDDAPTPDSQPSTAPAPTPVEDRPDADPQTEAALLVLRVKLLSGEPWAWSQPGTTTSVGKTARAQ